MSKKGNFMEELTTEEFKELPVFEEVKEEPVIVEEPVKEEVKHTGTITMH